jgi:hypothetical protein
VGTGFGTGGDGIGGRLVSAEVAKLAQECRRLGIVGREGNAVGLHERHEVGDEVLLRYVPFLAVKVGVRTGREGNGDEPGVWSMEGRCEEVIDRTANAGNVHPDLEARPRIEGLGDVLVKLVDEEGELRGLGGIVHPERETAEAANLVDGRVVRVGGRRLEDGYRGRVVKLADVHADRD